MTDAQVLREFATRQRRWLRALAELRAFHGSQMGKQTTPVQWMAGREMDAFSWLGYYWRQEMIWFGYGWSDGEWRPLIEADNRSRCSEIVEHMRMQLGGAWHRVVSEENLYRRLWSPPGFAGNTERELEWWQARSRELHEFLVTPAN